MGSAKRHCGDPHGVEGEIEQLGAAGRDLQRHAQAAQQRSTGGEGPQQRVRGEPKVDHEDGRHRDQRPLVTPARKWIRPIMSKTTRPGMSNAAADRQARGAG